MIVLVCHTVYFDGIVPGYGTGSQIAEYLKNRHTPHMFIMHSLYKGHATRIEIFDGTNTSVKYLGYSQFPLIIRGLQDIVITLLILFPFRSKIHMYIGIDPLNAVIGILLKPVFLFNRVIFYTADYAEGRFVNPVLNWTYHALDFIARTYTSKNWCVSTRMITLRKKQKIPESKLVFFPNVPLHIETIHTKVSSKYTDMVIVSALRNDTVNFDMAFQAVKYLSKRFPCIRLVIVGSGDDEIILKKMVRDMKIQTHVLFIGRKPNAEVYPILQKSTIGLALYRTNTPWTYYGDSTKTREYLSVGLPLIITDACSTADDIQKEKAGIVISEKEENLGCIIESLLKNTRVLTLYRKNALRYAKKLNIRNIIEMEILQYINN